MQDIARRRIVVESVADQDREVQVRTLIQHTWAELSEKKYADEHGHDLKYGNGPPALQQPLNALSTLFPSIENAACRADG